MQDETDPLAVPGGGGSGHRGRRRAADGVRDARRSGRARGPRRGLRRAAAVERGRRAFRPRRARAARQARRAIGAGHRRRPRHRPRDLPRRGARGRGRARLRHRRPGQPPCRLPARDAGGPRRNRTAGAGPRPALPLRARRCAQPRRAAPRRGRGGRRVRQARRRGRQRRHHGPRGHRGGERRGLARRARREPHRRRQHLPRRDPGHVGAAAGAHGRHRLPARADGGAHLAAVQRRQVGRDRAGEDGGAGTRRAGDHGERRLAHGREHRHAPQPPPICGRHPAQLSRRGAGKPGRYRLAHPASAWACPGWSRRTWPPWWCSSCRRRRAT